MFTRMRHQKQPILVPALKRLKLPHQHKDYDDDHNKAQTT
ncbi:hypothetical protein B932_2590 [Gluconobacter oxydans H24]|nr:hypothetical protein B932_2590 [Gluconobacter oxydans H24]